VGAVHGEHAEVCEQHHRARRDENDDRVERRQLSAI
jgi:hypothetical protein